MRFPGFIGPAYTLKSVNVDCQRCVNLYPEINENGKGKADEIAWLKSTPGLEKLINVGEGPIRLVHFDQTTIIGTGPTTRVFVVSGEEVYKLTCSGDVWSSELLGTLETSEGVVRAVSMNSDGEQTVFVDGTLNYLYWRYDSGGGVYIETFGDFSSYGYASVASATHVVLLDGYLVYNVANSNQFFVSNLNSLIVDPLAFSSSEGDPDNIVALIENQRDLWILNERTTEIFVNTGNADFPFERVQGGFIEKGILAKYSVAKIESTVFWLGRDKAGQGVVFAGRGLNPERISTHAIETAIQSYVNTENAVGYTYQSGGHSFYVLNFEEATWVFDLSTKLWHERCYTNSGVLERHRANFHAFIPEFGIHMLGDYANNKIYKFNEDYLSDDTVEITRLRAAPHISSEMKRLTCNSFQLDFEAGVGIDGSGQGSDPQIMLQFSDDGGHSWSNEKWGAAGKIGQYKQRAIWRRLGMFRDRVFRIKITDPVKVSLIGAELDLEQAAS